MPDFASNTMPAPVRALSGKAAIVGVGETDFHLDYKAARAKAEGYEPPAVEQLASTAFERALADAGLKRADIDGLSVSFIYGGPSPQETARMMGLAPRRLGRSGGVMAGLLPNVCAAIAAGDCDTVAMIYAAASRAIGRQYGGRTYDGEGAPASYAYHHPWGWSSQAAHWAFMWRYYQSAFGADEDDLGAVATQVRANAAANPNAVMQAPLSGEDYRRARYIVRPLRLLDLCLVNDGAVCLIVRRADLAMDGPHAPVLLAGWGAAKVKGDKMRALIQERLRPQLRHAGAQALDMAGLTLNDIQHFEGYDTSTIHLIAQVEGCGFVEPGAGIEFCKSGAMARGGRLPVNIGGGMLSEAYMHGWNHVAEITRQLRHEAGPRQIEAVRASMLSVAQTDQAHPLIFTRGA